MKKLFSMLCVAVLLCSALSIAVSAAGTINDPVIFAGKDFNMIKVPAGETYYASFTDTSGETKRQISVNSTTDKTAGYTVTYGDTVEASDANGYCNIVALPDANNTYLLAITNHSTKQATFFVSFYSIAPYIISDTLLFEGENAVITEEADATLFVFEPAETGIYEVLIDQPDAVLSHWNGSIFYVTGLAEEAVDGRLEITCASEGQSLLIGLSNIGSANITITKIGEYEAPLSVEYVTYVNKHTPVSGFALPDTELTAVDITIAQTVVLGEDGIYRYGSANGPIMYVDMTGVAFADLYECYYPATSGAQVADRLRGTYVDDDGNTCGYDFITAMKAYADALDAEGYYYLTEDLANYLQMYGKDQGWFEAEYSPFTAIQNSAFVEESAWLISAYYDPNSANQDPVIPDEPEEPSDPTEPSVPSDPSTPTVPSEPEQPSEPDSPATGDVSALGAMTALLLSSAGMVTFRKKRG